MPKPPRERGGRRRTYPDYMYLVYDALLSVYDSARQVEAELSHRVVWKFMRKIVKRTFPDDPSMHLPARPMRRHHYMYGRNRYLADPQVLEGLMALHREMAAGQARDLGLLDPDGPGTWTHPDPSRLLHADGKVVTPLFRARPGDRRTDKATGEIKELRYEPDASLHFEGGEAQAAWGTKFVLVATRTQDVRGRVILDFEWVEKQGAEARVALECFERVAPHVPGVQGVVYDTALRGVHHQKILRELGWMPINKVTAKTGRRNPRARRAKEVVEKSRYVEDKVVTLGDGTRTKLSIYARGGAIGIGELTDKGDVEFVALGRVRTYRKQCKNGLYRWYNDYGLPPAYGGGVVTVRLHADETDHVRRFNRTENVRPIAPTDPDFARLFARRNDSESLNRGLEDSLWLGRAHSVGRLRQQAELLGYALMVNSVALLEHRQRAPAARAA